MNTLPYLLLSYLTHLRHLNFKKHAIYIDSRRHNKEQTFKKKTKRKGYVYLFPQYLNSSLVIILYMLILESPI